MNEFPLEIPTRECRIAIVASEFNHFIVQQLVDGAFDALNRNSISEQNISLIWVPGAFELPLVADVLAGAGNHDAVIALGAVIRGGTPHFDYVAGECVKGITAASQKHAIPVGNGVLTVDTIEQAIERAGTKAGNKGEEATLAVVEMVNLLRQID